MVPGLGTLFPEEGLLFRFAGKQVSMKGTSFLSDGAVFLLRGRTVPYGRSQTVAACVSRTSRQARLRRLLRQLTLSGVLLT
jgi:hypothetical protein